MMGAGRGCLGEGGWRGGQGCWGGVLHWSRLVQGEAVKLEEAVDGEVKIVRWRWRDGRNYRILCEEWCHPRSVKIYGKIMSLVIGPQLSTKSHF